MKILAAVDGSSYTKRMLGYLTAHAEWLLAGHDITVLTVCAAVPSRAAAALDHETLQSYYEDEAEQVFKPIRSFFAAQGVTASFVRKTGHAAEVIAKTAEAGQFDLLLLGSHGHGALSSMVMGSITAKVLASCRTPALLIR